MYKLKTYSVAGINYALLADRKNNLGYIASAPTVQEAIKAVFTNLNNHLNNAKNN